MQKIKNYIKDNIVYILSVLAPATTILVNLGKITGLTPLSKYSMEIVNFIESFALLVLMPLCIYGIISVGFSKLKEIQNDIFIGKLLSQIRAEEVLVHTKDQGFMPKGKTIDAEKEQLIKIVSDKLPKKSRHAIKNMIEKYFDYV